MLIRFLAQAAQPNGSEASPEGGLFGLLLIAALLCIVLLVVIGLLAAWRNLILRQREMEWAHEDREDDLPHPDAWSTAAQRMSPPQADPDEAHVSPGLNPEESTDPYDGPNDKDDDDDDDDDDFPFDDDDDEPIGRT